MEALHEFKLRRDEVPEGLREGPLAAEYRENFLKNTPQTFADTAHALFSMPVLRDELHKISVPTWVCHGENDAGPIDFSEVYAKHVPDCTTSIIPDAGHSSFWDQPGPSSPRWRSSLRKTRSEPPAWVGRLLKKPGVRGKGNPPYPPGGSDTKSE